MCAHGLPPGLVASTFGPAVIDEKRKTVTLVEKHPDLRRAKDF